MGAEEQQGVEGKEEGGAPPKKGDSVFAKKVIKIVTVMAYASGISSAGVLLSLYYILFWDPQITGVRPPGYLQSGEMIGVPQARVATIPQAFKGDKPIPYPHKMSSEFMDAYFKNDTTADEVGSPGDLSEGQPTPKALPVVKEGGYEAAHPAPAHFTAPTQPLPGHHPNSAQGVGVDSSPGFSQHHRTTSREQQQLNQQQRHHQQQRYRQMQQEQQQQQDQLTALA